MNISRVCSGGLLLSADKDWWEDAGVWGERVLTDVSAWMAATATAPVSFFSSHDLKSMTTCGSPAMLSHTPDGFHPFSMSNDRPSFLEKWSWKACTSMPRDFLRGGRRGFQSGGGASSCCCRLRWVCPLRRPFQRGTAKVLEKWTCPRPGETTNVGRRNRRGKERPRSRSEISESPAIQRPRALTPDQKSSPPRPTRAPRETASSLPPQTHNLHNTTGVVCLDV